ncbi:MAG: CPBP family intramembrane glutamic endopeptidase [Terriglobia bacterium]|nr:CPBP family intramembrane glutamic endopeptidase [Terriglobia bacterium]
MTRPFLGVLVFALLLEGFWVEVHAFRISQTLGGHIAPAFICFALLLVPLWFFGFGLGEPLAKIKPVALRVLVPATLAVPYLIFSIPRHEFHWIYFISLALIPVATAAIIEFSRLPQKLTLQDVVVLLALALILETHAVGGAWPYPGLGSLPKLYLADVALYVYIVNRRLEGIGYSFVPTDSGDPSRAQSSAKAWRGLIPFAIGLREWCFFAPIGIGLGLVLHFIRFFPRVHNAIEIIGALLVTFLLTAIPEELFFRGILQNLLEPWMGRTRALFTASVLFGLSHYPKGAIFNWRYVILAFIAGIFYGRAWRSRRQILASATTHTLVDTVWSLWFR